MSERKLPDQQEQEGDNLKDAATIASTGVGGTAVGVAIVGAISSSAAGAAFGTVFPVVGTAIGGGLGLIAGIYTGAKLVSQEKKKAGK